MRVRTFSRGALGVLAWGLVVILLPNVVLRLVAHDRLWVSIVLNMMTPYLYAPAYLALAIALWQRRRVLSVLAGAVVVAHGVWTFGPLARAEVAIADPASAHARTIRVFSANVMAWTDTTEGIVDEIQRSGADILAIQELSPIWQAALSTPDLLLAFPHRIEVVQTDAGGSGVYARWPLRDADILQTPSMPVARATVVVAGDPVRVYSVHALPPARSDWVGEWSRGLGAILEAARRETLPVILAGDFNATPHSAWHARFHDRGFRDSHHLCGRPLATTWPNGALAIPPVRLDHVLVSPALGCVYVVEGVGEGSDHRPILVDLRLSATLGG